MEAPRRTRERKNAFNESFLNGSLCCREWHWQWKQFVLVLEMFTRNIQEGTQRTGWLQHQQFAARYAIHLQWASNQLFHYEFIAQSLLLQPIQIQVKKEFPCRRNPWHSDARQVLQIDQDGWKTSLKLLVCVLLRSYILALYLTSQEDLEEWEMKAMKGCYSIILDTVLISEGNLTNTITVAYRVRVY